MLFCTSVCVWCVLLQSSSLAFTVTNTSNLPQKFGFVGLPPEVRVVPNQGFGTLLPRESVTVNVVYSPTSATGQLGCVLLRMACG